MSSTDGYTGDVPPGGPEGGEAEASRAPRRVIGFHASQVIKSRIDRALAKLG